MVWVRLLSKNFMHYLCSLLCFQPLTPNWFLPSAYEQGQTSPSLKTNYINKWKTKSPWKKKIPPPAPTSIFTLVRKGELPQEGILGLTNAWVSSPVGVSCLAFLNQKIDLCHQFWKILNHYLFKYCLCSIFSPFLPKLQLNIYWTFSLYCLTYRLICIFHLGALWASFWMASDLSSPSTFFVNLIA